MKTRWPTSAEPSTDSTAEAALLLANLESALRRLEQGCNGANGSAKSFTSLESALHTYGAVKHLLPKLDLSPQQRAPVEEQLQKLRARIVAQSALK